MMGAALVVMADSGKERAGIPAMSEDSLLERVTAAAEERHLSQNTLTAYRRTWIKTDRVGGRRRSCA